MKSPTEHLRLQCARGSSGSNADAASAGGGGGGGGGRGGGGGCAENLHVNDSGLV